MSKVKVPETTSPSLRQRVKEIEEKLEELQRAYTRFGEGISQALGHIVRRIDELFIHREEHSVILEALANRLGREEVEEEVDRIIRDQHEQALVANLGAGKVVQVEVLTEKSTIVGVMKDKEGKVIRPGRLQTQIANTKPEIKVKLLGRKAGDVVEIEEGVIEVLGAYEVVPPQKEEASSSGLDPVTEVPGGEKR